MAEETQPDQPAKEPSKKRRTRRKTTEAPAAKKAPAAKNASTEKKVEVLATEQPVPSAPLKKTSEYVVTVDNQTGLPIKIDKLDEATGDRRELTRQEYEQALAYAGLLPASASGGLASSAPPSSANTDDLVQAYYQGVADYINALTSHK